MSPRHGRKVLSQAGTSLADIYDVEGSIVGIDALDADEVKLVHEMGEAIQSERFSGRIIQISSGAIAQSTTFGVPFQMATTPERILHLAIVGDAASRTQSLSLSTANVDGAGVVSTECPLWAWSTGAGTDLDKPITMSLNGSVVNLRIFQSLGVVGPSMSVGDEQPQVMDRLVFRGQSTAFGAGTVTYTALIATAFTTAAGLSSKGLPVPSW